MIRRIGDAVEDVGAAVNRDGVPGPPWPRLCHELRTPLNAILGNTELLLDGSAGPLSDQARACLGDIQAAGNRLMRHVQVLLELCHAHTRPSIATEVAIDLVELLRGAHAAAPALAHGATIRVMPAHARYIVRGDTTWLGALAGALVELYLGDGQVRGPLLVATERRGPPSSGAAMRLWWVNFHPEQVAALPIALIDAILSLHEGVVSLTEDGLRLYWPAARLVHLEPSEALLAGERNAV